MNRVGAGGRGESVWLTWFLALVLRKFAPVCRHMEEPQLAEELLGRAEGYRKAAEAAWDGNWYRRGYFDSGAPLGTRGAESCEIDSIAQSFAALVEDSDRERACQAVSAALERLYLPQAGVVKLFDPPFHGQGPGPGLYQGLSARRAGERGTVHPWGCVAGSGLPPPGPDGGWAGAAAGPPAGAPPDADLSGGALCAGRRCLCGPGAPGPGRLELVHRGGGVVLPHRGGGAAGPEGPGRPLVCGAPACRRTGRAGPGSGNWTGGG